MTTSIDVQQIAQALWDDPESSNALNAASSAIAEGQGVPVLRALIDNRRPESSETAAIDATMTLLEKIIPIAQEVGEYFMIKLYSIAAPYFMHDIGDAIELWLSERARPELAAKIRSLVAEEPDTSIQKRMLEWAADWEKTPE